MLEPVRSARAFFSACFVVAFSTGCGGGSGAAPSAPIAVPTPSPSPTPLPGGPLTPSQSSAAFTLPGQSAPVTLSEPAYTDTVTADATACSGVATVTPASAAAPATFTLTAQGSGSCTVGFTDRFGQRAAVSIGVTVTQGTIK